MSYHHITITERCCIYQFLNSEMSIRAIAKTLKRSPSTISRGIARNTSQDAETSTYCPSKAKMKAYYIFREETALLTVIAHCANAWPRASTLASEGL